VKIGDDFIVQLNSSLENHKLYLAKVKPLKTMKETVIESEKRVSSSRGESMADCGSLNIPILDFEIMKISQDSLDLQELTELQLQAPLSIQKVRFRLDERGAILKASSLHIFGSCDDLIFDKPFLLYMKYEKTNTVYFAIWVDNSEIMVRDQVSI
jgi:hypothetical protein